MVEKVPLSLPGESNFMEINYVNISTQCVCVCSSFGDASETVAKELRERQEEEAA